MNDITQSAEYDIRYTRLTDISYVKRWVKDPGVMRYLPMENNQHDEIEGFCKNLVGFYRYEAALTAIYMMKPIGIGVIYLMPYKKVAHHAMMQVIVDPEWQNKKVGRSLVKNLLHHAENHFRLEQIDIEIMADHPFRSVLNTFGFEEIYRQEGFYQRDGQYLARVMMGCQLG